MYQCLMTVGSAWGFSVLKCSPAIVETQLHFVPIFFFKNETLAFGLLQLLQFLFYLESINSNK